MRELGWNFAGLTDNSHGRQGLAVLMDVNSGYPGAFEMRILFVILMLLPLSSAVMPSDARAQMTAETRAFIVSEHNRLRRDAIGPGGPDVVSPVTATAMLEIEYDMALECVAQAYVNVQTQGTYQPNQLRSSEYVTCGGPAGSYVGENYYSGTPQVDVTGGASRAWVDFVWPIPWGGNGCSERENYHGDRGCSGIISGYTQVLWANTLKVGCGYNPGIGTVCNYYPGSNYPEQSVFVIGAACSVCPASRPFCNSGLCSSVQPGEPIFSNGFELLP